MSEITVELGEPEVEIDYSALAQSLMEYATETITEIANEAVEHYMTYDLDISEQVHDAVSDAVGDTVNSHVESLLDEVGPGGLCGLGSSFRDAIETVLIHHIDMKEVLINNYAIDTSGGISKLVQDALQKEMVVNVSFVDKKPAEVVTVTGHEIAGVTSDVPYDLLPGPEVVQETSNSATDLSSGPVQASSDEIKDRSENV